MKTSVWIIIGVIVIALIAAFAFSMEGDNAGMTATTTPSAQTASDTAADTTSADLAQVRAQAVADLASLRARVESGETYASLIDDYAVIRARVTAAYAASGGLASQEWQDIQAGFEGFETSVRANSSAALDSFASLIARLSADVGTETPAEAE